MSDEPRLAMGVREAAAAIGVGKDALYKAIRRGEIRTTKLGSKTLVPVQELERLLGIERPEPPSNVQVVQAVMEVLGVDHEAIAS